MRIKRASENECETVERKMLNKLFMSRERALETDKKQKRLSEANDEALCRKESNMCVTRKKRLLETDDEALAPLISTFL